MSNADKKATIIYLVDSMILSKNEYSDWREIQDEYGEKYKTNLAPLTCDETIDFFKDDFKQEENWPFTKKQIVDFLKGRKVLFVQSVYSMEAIWKG